jgi:hypothetical protein
MESTSQDESNVGGASPETVNAKSWRLRTTKGRILIAVLVVECLLLWGGVLFDKESVWFAWVALFTVATFALALLFVVTRLALGVMANIHRARYQFSLRTLLICMLIFAVAFAWIGRRIANKHKEQEAIDAVVKLGGMASPGNSSVDTDNRPGPVWLHTLLGKNFFSGDVDSVSLIDAKLTQTGLEPVSALKTLRCLVLFRSTVTDSELTHLNSLPQLKMLELGSTNISDAGLADIGRFKELERLDLDDTRVTDEGLDHLLELPKLTKLDLSGTRITDAGIRKLSRLSGLRWLILERTAITDAGLVHIKRMSNLASLALFGTKVSEAGVDELRQTLIHCTVETQRQ